MGNRISKISDAAMARATFDLAKADIRQSYKDRLALELLREDSSMAYNTLSTMLSREELQNLSLRIKNMVASQPKQEELSPEDFMRSYRDMLLDTFDSAKTISTIHILRDIVADTTTATSQILAIYGVTAQSIDHSIESVSTPTVIMQSEAQFGPSFFNDNHLNSLSAQHPKAEKLLDKFGIDLTLLAQQGKIDPVVGRDAEIQRVLQILSRRRKNNPILIGEAGVGKSAIVEGLALRIVAGDVPSTIRGKRIFSLDVSSLIAGTKFRGEFEERMQQLLDELRKETQTIIFIDEIHTIVGAGATQGSLDTANILKPALARGELQTIGTTTLDEYRENIECDSALERRFQKVIVEPTSATQTLEILHRIAPHYEKYHNVKYSQEALEACVTLTERYITDRHFPDKAIDIMDEAGARSRLEGDVLPLPIRQTEQDLEFAKQERNEAIATLAYEKAAIARLKEIALKSRLDEQRREWDKEMQKNPRGIEAKDIEQVITSITGIPTERISENDAHRLRGLKSHLSERVVGQEQAVERITKSLIRSRVGLKDENRPIGVFMFVGPTGVGKTLLAKELSKWLFDQKRGLIRIDMSEYSEKHNVARLIGSPPGYVGYGEGGQLSEAVRRKPYSVVLFDEIEKAHSDVFNIMLQIFDEGRLTDGAGREVDFKNTVIILTSNIGSRNVAERSIQVGYNTSSKQNNTTLTPRHEYDKALESQFAPEFLNRLDDIIYFRTLELEDVEQIIDLELGNILRKARNLGLDIAITPEARRLLATMGYESKYGVRALRRTLIDKVEEPLSALIVEQNLSAGTNIKIESQDEQIEVRVA